jgi:Fe-S cluster assembly protein SufB
MSSEYKYGFVTEVEADTLPKGLDEGVIEAISAKKDEPSWMLDFRIKAYRLWQTMKEPHFANVSYQKIDYQSLSYYSAPKKKAKKELSEVDPELLKTLDKLGIPRAEQERLTGVAVDVVFDSVSLGTSLREELKAKGIILCPISEAVHEHEALVKKYLASVVPVNDNFFAALNSAVFSDGSFVYIPKGVRCPVELSTYFRLNDRNVGQFERTLIIAEEDSYVSYLEGCTAPAHDINQLHAAVVELVAFERAEIKYSTVQNWYAGDPETGKGGVFNFVTKRGLCAGKESKISWTQVEAGAAITWKYPGCILEGDNSSGEFYSVTLTNGHMQADSGTRMIHKGKNTKSTIISKGISSDRSKNTYRGVVRVHEEADNARNYSCCDSMLVGSACSAHTFPTIEAKAKDAQMEHEASTSKISDEQLFYLRSRGMSSEDAVSLIISGFCGRVLEELPLEFAQEAKQLLALKLERSVG